MSLYCIYHERGDSDDYCRCVGREGRCPNDCGNSVFDQKRQLCAGCFDDLRVQIFQKISRSGLLTPMEIVTLDDWMADPDAEFVIGQCNERHYNGQTTKVENEQERIVRDRLQRQREQAVGR